jgi:hypothetical protein
VLACQQCLQAFEHFFTVFPVVFVAGSVHVALRHRRDSKPSAVGQYYDCGAPLQAQVIRQVSPVPFEWAVGESPVVLHLFYNLRMSFFLERHQKAA